MASKTVPVGSENTRTITFGKRHKVTVTFRRIAGVWHAHAGLMPLCRRNLRDCRIAVRARLIQLAHDNGIGAGE